MAGWLAFDAPEAAADGAAGSQRPPVVLPPTPEQRKMKRKGQGLWCLGFSVERCWGALVGEQNAPRARA
jgi:hypothetical protein